jgi:DNA polymerase alpha-associated DNA helicase A
MVDKIISKGISCSLIYPTVAMTRAKRHLVDMQMLILMVFTNQDSQCIVGDSSTVKHGSPYLKKWLAWLEANADVRFAEFDSI